MEIETDRLLLRRPLLSDAADLIRFLGDVDAMRYTQSIVNLRECRRYLAAHERQRRKTGCGPWIVLAKTDRAIVGFGGLYDDPFDAGWGLEVSYRFAPSAWGRGHATELTTFCLKLARETLEIAEVKAFAHPDNAASRRVLEKTGFERRRFVPEMNRDLYVRQLASADRL
jgi:RimJ/RimL family protein N-acetyltransferase